VITFLGSSLILNNKLLFFYCCNFFIARYMNDVAEEIFSYLDYSSLKQSERVSELWNKNVLFGNTWKTLLHKNV